MADNYRIRYATVMGELLGCTKLVRRVLDSSLPHIWTNGHNMFHHHCNENGVWRIRDSYCREEPDSCWVNEQFDVEVLNDWLSMMSDYIEANTRILTHIQCCTECRVDGCMTLAHLISSSTSSENEQCPSTSAP